VTGISGILKRDLPKVSDALPVEIAMILIQKK
jgi:hypothetical protein